MSINIIERAVTPYNEPTSRLIQRERYNLFAPMAGLERIGMAGYRQTDFAVIDGIVYIANGSITTDKLASSSVTASKIASYSVTTDKLQDNAITTEKITDGAVTTSKIADNAITLEKFSNAWTAEQQSAIREILGIKTYVEEYVQQFLNMPEAEESEF